ncbi:hypothetical protein PH210_24090 [Paenibacillus sp. BSR1-1]|uniref:hypothetical protein n=1 Tax=Paenibacillus sp. BSR1-1 TaxID=3020845 RepID=UPI0025B1B207|nr:hypothetical protein [Paenibacillus sp. BSR1-1]MDN3019256.1 hypothetical protein [Paenibacillus sp. BSR1-1]
MGLKISQKTKRWLLIFHLLFAAIMLGNMTAFLIFSITAASASDEELIQTCYQAMHILSKTSVRASTIGTTVTGILLSVWTKWGLFSYYWIIAKEGLTVLCIFLNFWGMYTWTLQAISKTNALFFVKTELWTGIIIQIISLVLLYIISVIKPWGKRVSTTRLS